MTYGHEPQNDVAEFYRALGVAIGGTPEIRRPELRAAMLAGETKSTIEAADANDLVHAAAGLCNLIYAAYGAALEWGLDLKPFWDAIHRANMQRAQGGEWEKPDFAGILRSQIASGNFTSIIGRSATEALS